MSEFETMSIAELKTYLISHRDDDAAWAKYITRLVATDSKCYPAPIDEAGEEIMQEAFRRRLGAPTEGED